jgi:hypothetical protein
LSRLWKIGEGCIPAKRDKFGRRFAFARFVEVLNAQSLLKKIEEIWFDTYKLRANVSRFTKEEDDSGATVKQNGHLQQQHGEVNKGVSESNAGLRKDVSFMEILGVGGKKGKAEQHGKKKKTQNHEDYLAGVLEIDSVPENVENLKQCYVGTLWDAKLAANAQMMISMEGYQHLKATMLGMDKILLSSSMEDGVTKAYEGDKQWWESKFSDIKPWSPIQKSVGRLIWTRIFGAPPHAWGWEWFHRIVQSFGKLIQLDSQTVKQDRLDVARALISVSSWDFIDKVLDIKVNNELFVIRIVEERFGDINLGFKKEIDSQNFSDGTASDKSISDTEDDGGNGRKNDLEGGGVWNEGWPIDESGGQNRRGYCPQVNNGVVVVSDIPAKGVEERELVVVEIGTDRTEEEKCEEERCSAEEQTRLKKKNHILALTWVGSEEVGEEESLSALQSEKQRDVLQNSRDEVGEEERVLETQLTNSVNGSNEVDQDLGLDCLVIQNNKGKGIMIEEDDVAMKDRFLFKGSCSKKSIGPDGPEVVGGEEYQHVILIKDVEVAQLAFFHEKTERERLIESQTKLVKSKKQKKGGNGANSNFMKGGFTKTARLVKALKDGPRGKKTNKKNKKSSGMARELHQEAEEDLICNNEDVVGLHLGPTIPIASLEVALFEGESRSGDDEAIRLYRIEAERLFNIGMNMGVSTNAERISMVEKLMELEDKEENAIEEWEDDMVNQ